MSQLSTTPDTVEMASTETKTVTINFAAELGTATIVSTAATLKNLYTGVNHATGLGTRTNTTTVVDQTLTALEAGAKYRLAVTVTDSIGEVTTSETTVICQF